VSDLVGYGFTNEYIAGYLKLSQPTLRLHYKDEIANGKTALRHFATQSVFQQAFGSRARPNRDPANNALKMFVMKTQFGWREVDRRLDQLEDMVKAVMQSVQTMPMDEWEKRYPPVKAVVNGSQPNGKHVKGKRRNA